MARLEEQTIEDMRLITSTQARAILSIEGKPISYKTFMKVVKEAKIRPAQTLTQGTHLYTEDDIIALKKRLTKKRVVGHSVLEE